MNTKQQLTVVAVLALALVAGVLVGSGVTAAQSPFDYIVSLVKGEVVQVTCTDANRLRADRQGDLEVWLTCGRVATATPVPQPTATPVPQPTATPVVGDMVDMVWHAPAAHGDRPTHEHGDAPPAWLLTALGYTDPSQLMLFTHDANTPGETIPYWKHTGFKGWETNFNGQACYGVFHLDFNPGGHVSRFHSYQLWCQDSAGALSAVHGWLDFGTGNNTGPQVVVTCGQDSNVRPIMLVNQAGCPVRFENWYAAAGGNGDWAPDFGFNINPNYFAGGDPVNPATWTDTGYVRNLERRIEFAWYLGVDGIRPAPRGEFWSTQWGEIVGGPDAPICGTQRTIGDRSYTVLCLRQYIAPTLQPMTFPGNSEGGTFPGDGVVLPN